jgi:endo-1,4-beta-xylanase
VTELDVTDSATPKDIPKRDAEVAALYKEFLTATLACKAVTSVITWGISDRYSWVVDGVEKQHRRSDGAPPRPLPYDKELVAKPAYAALAAALAAAPKR